MSSRSDNTSDAIRRRSRDRQLIAEMLNKRAADEVVDEERRNDQRRPFTPGDVIMSIAQPTGPPNRLSVLPRNLSPQGVACIVSQFIYPNTRCDVELPMRDGKTAMLEGTVTRCEHVMGMLHEVAVKFGRDIAMDKFLAAAPAPLPSDREPVGEPTIFRKPLVTSAASEVEVTGGVMFNGEAMDCAALESMLATAQEALDAERAAPEPEAAPSRQRGRATALQIVIDMLRRFIDMIRSAFQTAG